MLDIHSILYYIFARLSTVFYILEDKMSKIKNSVFAGCATALVTPFKDGKIDYDTLEWNIEFQIACGIDALVICGTTGEVASLSEDEHKSCIDFAVKTVAGRIPLIAGTGSNNTAHAIRMSCFACEYGADALLVVTPYYNKASASGLLRHYLAIANTVTKPIILYNVPSRTGVDLPLSVCEELSHHERIVALKDASGNIARAEEMISRFGDRLELYCGNDDIILPMLAVGCTGAISVASNIIPRELADLCRLWREGKHSASAEISKKYAPLIRALSTEVNPIPIKTAMAKMGFCHEEFRLPLCEAEEKNRALIYNALNKFNLHRE